MLASSLDEADAEDGFVGVLLGGVLAGGAALAESGVRAGVVALEAGLVTFSSALARAALASRSLLVLVGRGVIFILTAPSRGASGLVSSLAAAGFCSGCGLCLGSLAGPGAVEDMGLVPGWGRGGAALVVVGAVAGLGAGRGAARVMPVLTGLALVSGTAPLPGRAEGLGLAAAAARGTRGLAAGAGAALPAALGVVLVNANVDGGLGDFLTPGAADLTTDLASLATSSVGTFSLSLTSSICGSVAWFSSTLGLVSSLFVSFITLSFEGG